MPPTSTSMSVWLNLQAIVVHIVSLEIVFSGGIINMMWIQHPEVQNYYQYMRNQNGSFSSIATLTKRDKKELCRSRITVFTVCMEHSCSSSEVSPDLSVHGRSKMLYPVIHPFNYSNFVRTYAENLPDESTDHVTVFVNIETELVLTEALPCIIYGTNAWFIINGYETNVYFTAETSAIGEPFRLTGILEPYPKICFYRSDRKRELEEKFLIGQRWVALTKQRTSLCKLTVLQKFRLCSTIYVAWRDRLPYVAMSWYRMRDVNGNTCLKHVILSSESKENNELSPVPVDLLVCQARPGDRPAFYVTADEAALNSVFAVTRKSEHERKYYLSAHVTDVTVLKNAINGDFMVKTFVNDDVLDYF